MVKATHLLCEYEENPVGVGTGKPAFSWRMEGEKDPVFQSSYQIVAALDETFNQLIWDTGRRFNGRSVCNVYDGGMPLKSATKYYWKVRLWDQDGEAGPFSAVHHFVTSLLSGGEEWEGAWITAESEADFFTSCGHYMKKEFDLPEGEIASAYLFASAHGIYEAAVNGIKAGDGILTPGWTEYQKRILFQMYDVKDLLKDKKNTICAHVGPGWYKGDLAGWIHLRGVYGHLTGFNAMLLIRYTDGRECRIVTDRSWQWRYSPAVYSEIYHGEIWDARLLSDENLHWASVKETGEPVDTLVPMDGVFVRRKETVSPKRLFYTPNGELVLDFGQNMVGWVKVRASGQAGDCVELSHGEVLDREGNFYTGNLREARQRVKYLLNGGGTEVFEPYFTWQGFQYVRIDHYPGTPVLEDFTGVVIYSDLQQSGFFKCSDPLINRLEENIRWGMKGNFVDIPTDCPQRDERMGWTGDIQVFARTASYLMKTAPFFRKWLRDLQAAQLPDGGIPYVVPDILTHQDRDVRDADANHSASGWGDAAVVCPYTVYKYSGDRRFLEEAYPMMKRWVGYIENRAEDGVIWNSGYQYGDWLALDAGSGGRFGKTPNDLTATAYYAHSVELVRRAAVILGKEKDAEKYSGLSERIKKSFRKKFYDENGCLKAGTQTAHVLALAFDLAGDEFRQRTIDDLEALIDEWNGLSTGFLGTPHICHVLKENGRVDAAYRLLMKKEYPSWLYPVIKGATTIWEHWDSIRTDGSFWSDSMNSFNHYAYGCIGDWLYSTILGIDTSEEEPGYHESIVSPVPGGGITWAEGGCYTPYGLLEVKWSLDDGAFFLHVNVPANTKCRVCLPGTGETYAVGSGKHEFQCRMEREEM